MGQPIAARTSRKKKGPNDVKAQFENAKKKLAALERRVYAAEIDELIKKLNIASSFKVIKANIKGASDIAILEAIGRNVGLKRLSITQEDPKPRKPKVKNSDDTK